MPLNIHYLQHVPFEGPGYIADWAAENGHHLTAHRLFAGEALPDPDNTDLLIIMGGPMGVYEEAEFPWLGTEKQFIRSMIDDGKKVLGVCLGAQLIAAAMGAAVYPNHQKEIGWFPVHPAGNAILLPWTEILEGSPTVFHWHGDTFDLPPGAVLHASTPACRNQLYTIGPNVTGIQFHFEVTLPAVREMIAHGREELVQDEFIQDAEEIAAKAPDHVTACNRAMHRLLDHIIV